MALPPTTANWHWKNKNVTSWGKAWFERELTTISIDGDSEGEVIAVSKVTEVDGDIELGQRKSKLITIYDCKIILDWSGIASDGTEVKGKLTIPEVSHEITLDRLSDYAYSWTLSTNSSPAVDALFHIAKTRLPTALETKFAEFPTALIDTHGKDLTVSTDPSRSGTPAPNAAATSASAGGTPAAAAAVKPIKKPEEKKLFNTASVSVEATFMAAADDLFSILTDEKRIPSWTRAPAKSIVEVEGEFSLFGGGVKGKYLSLTPPNEIVQSWALQSPTWPSDHTGTLTTTLDQSSDSTKITFTLTGVPKGLEDEIKRNLEGYYIHGLKSIGYVQLFPSPPSYPSRPSTSPNRKHGVGAKKTASKTTNDTGNIITAVVIASLVLVAAFSIPYLSSLSPPVSHSK